MADFVVTTIDDSVADDGVTSLREALVLAEASAGADTISFDAGLSGRTITLGGSGLVLSSDVTIDGDIDGDGAADITISGNDMSAVIYAISGTSTLHALTLSNGWNGNVAGGINVDVGATLHLTNSTVSNNEGFFGGAISNDGALTVTNSTISHNSAGYGGGIYNWGTATLTNTTVSLNFGTYYAGGIFNQGPMMLINSTVSRNDSLFGGGIFSKTSETTLINSIVLGNSDADLLGAGTITNSLVGGYGVDASEVFAGYLADNGGPVQTIALLNDVSNPALDAGDDSAAPALDAAGQARVDVAVANNGANISDLGALEMVEELAPEADSLTVTTADDTVDAFDGLTSLGEALAFANSDVDASTITFDVSLSGQTITLGGAQLLLSTDVTIDGDIDGDDVADITVSGGNFLTAASRVFMIESGTSTLDALTITHGHAGLYNGGGIYIAQGATVDINNSTISGNRAGAGTGTHFTFGKGGGVYNAGTAIITNSTISDNRSIISGGGIHNSGSMTVIESTMSGNFVGYSSYYFQTKVGSGGGVFNSGNGILTLTDSTVSGNEATLGGGGFENQGTATLTNSTVSGNEAQSGGGVTNLGTVTLTSSTLSGNATQLGGGGIDNQGTATLTNSTVSGNNAVAGGGLTNQGSLTLSNSIVLGNTALRGADEIESGGTLTVNNSLTGAGGETAADVFAALDGAGGLLADNGGSVLTIALNNEAANPALDAGDDAVAPATDAAGLGRVNVPVSNNGPNISDLGALEMQQDLAPEADSLIVTTAEDVVDAFDGKTSLREALAFANSDADASTITFQGSLSGQTITLAGSELVLTSDVTIEGDINGDDVADVTISGNDASRVFEVRTGTATLNALTITGGHTDGNGGGISVRSGATVELFSSAIVGNTAVGSGGGIYNQGNLTVIESILEGNVAGRYGGGVNNYDGRISVAGSTFDGNIAGSDGGGINSTGRLGASVTVAGSSFSGNLASDRGGAIGINGFYGFDRFDVSNSTISGNSAYQGGGIYNFGNANVTNSTVSGNEAQYGGGISTASIMSLTNSIVLGNNAATDAEVSIFGTFTASNSLVGADGETAADVFAELDTSGGGLLADNGGPVQTIALRAGPLNPALDAGDDAAAPETDARGTLRADTLNVVNNGLNISDIGAFELVSAQSGSNGPDVITGTDLSEILSGNGGSDVIYGLGGSDIITGDFGNDQLFGGNGRDFMLGGSGADQIEGGLQDDDLQGGAGNDVVMGGNGVDQLSGGDGNDRITGGLGADLLYGGADADTFIYLSADESLTGSSADRIFDFVQGEDVINFRAVSPAVFDFIGQSVFSGTGPEIRIIESANGNTSIFADVDGDTTADMRVVVIGVTGLTENDFLL